MKITFNTITTTIRQNADGLFSLTDIAQAWEQSGGTGGDLSNWKRNPEVADMIARREIHVLNNHGGSTVDRGTWGCKEAVIEYASYCSPEFRRAVRRSFIALTEGNVYQAAAIAQAVAIDPELVAKYDAAVARMNATIEEYAAPSNPYAYKHYADLACKAVTGYTAGVFTGGTESAKERMIKAKRSDCMAAAVAAMDVIVRGLISGQKYHAIAFTLNVKTSKNGDLMGLLDVKEAA